MGLFRFAIFTIISTSSKVASWWCYPKGRAASWSHRFPLHFVTWQNSFSPGTFHPPFFLRLFYCRRHLSKSKVVGHLRSSLLAEKECHIILYSYQPMNLFYFFLLRLILNCWNWSGRNHRFGNDLISSKSWWWKTWLNGWWRGLNWHNLQALLDIFLLQISTRIFGSTVPWVFVAAGLELSDARLPWSELFRRFFV